MFMYIYIYTHGYGAHNGVYIEMGLRVEFRFLVLWIFVDVGVATLVYRAMLQKW